MSDIAIKIEGLGKRYRYGGTAPLSANLRADLTDWLRGLLPRNRRSEIGVSSSSRTPILPSSQLPTPISAPSPNSQLPTPAHHPTLHEVHEERIAHDPNYFWALKDIDLEVRQGEACPPKSLQQRRIVGIIGRNGAGKPLGQSV